jgi:hypothetical protein
MDVDTWLSELRDRVRLALSLGVSVDDAREAIESGLIESGEASPMLAGMVASRVTSEAIADMPESALTPGQIEMRKGWLAARQRLWD